MCVLVPCTGVCVCVCGRAGAPVLHKHQPHHGEWSVGRSAPALSPRHCVTLGTLWEEAAPAVRAERLLGHIRLFPRVCFLFSCFWGNLWDRLEGAARVTCHGSVGHVPLEGPESPW